MVRSISSGSSPAFMAALESSLETSHSESTPADTNCPKEKADLLSCSFLLPVGLLATASASSLRAASAYLRVLASSLTAAFWRASLPVLSSFAAFCSSLEEKVMPMAWSPCRRSARAMAAGGLESKSR